jgi:hypothetical protein
MSRRTHQFEIADWCPTRRTKVTPSDCLAASHIVATMKLTNSRGHPLDGTPRLVPHPMAVPDRKRLYN